MSSASSDGNKVPLTSLEPYLKEKVTTSGDFESPKAKAFIDDSVT